MNITRYPITPVPAPRQTRRSRFNPKHAGAIGGYRAFRDEVRWQKVRVPDSCYLRFEIPVPKCGAKRIGQPHTQKPDLDNLIKALLDSVFQDDAHVHRIYAEKVWAEKGAIVVGDLEEFGR